MKLMIATVFLLFASLVSGKNLESRVTGGVSARSGQVKCYVALLIDGETIGTKYCGGCLLSPEDKIVTAASCLYSQDEGKAYAIRFFTSLAGPDGSQNTQIRMKEIYKSSTFVIENQTPGSDIAIITLTNKITPTSILAGAVPSTEDKQDAYFGEDLFVCGHGFIDNNRTRPGSRGLQCTTLRVINADKCPFAKPIPAGVALPKGTICTVNNDDRNVCGGDQGSPVFSNKTGTLQLVGVVSQYPNSRPNARCRDGHHVIVTQLGSFKDFIQDPTNPKF